MGLLYTVFVTLIALGVLIIIHEWGHFWVARLCGVKVQRFSIGFGKPLLKFTDQQQTEYVVAAIPLGGYVKMLDENNEVVAEQEKPFAFNRQALWKRVAIVSAGPLANFILAALLFYTLFLGGVTHYRAVIDQVLPNSLAEQAQLQTGDEIVQLNHRAIDSRQELNRRLLAYYGERSKPLNLAVRSVDGRISEHQLNISWQDEHLSPMEVLGVSLYLPAVSNVLAKVLPHSAAAQAGLLAGDQLQTLNGKTISEWQAWSELIRAHPGKVMRMGVLRQGSLIEIAVLPKVVKRAGEDVGQIGVIPQMEPWPVEMQARRDYSVLSAWPPALNEMLDKTQLTLSMLKKMVTGKVSVKQIGGPVSIAQQASASSKLGWRPFIGLMALLSISLGVLNLLPIPALDGGHLLFYMVEAVRGKPLSKERQAVVLQIGMIFLFGFMLFAIYNDIARL